MCLRASCVIFDNLSCMFSASYVSGKHNSALPPTHSGDKKSGWSEWLACYRASVFPDQSRLISGFSALLISGLPHTHYCRNWDTMAPVSKKCNHVIFLPLSLKVTAFHWFWLSPLSNTGKPYMWKMFTCVPNLPLKTHTYISLPFILTHECVQSMKLLWQAQMGRRHGNKMIYETCCCTLCLWPDPHMGRCTGWWWSYRQEAKPVTTVQVSTFVSVTLLDTSEQFPVCVDEMRSS